MIKLSVMYPQQQGKRFNVEYYLKDHRAAIERTWAGLLKDAYFVRGISGGAADAPPTYHIMAQLSFASMDDLKKALERGGELFADIPNFTDIKPTVQISEVIG